MKLLEVWKRIGKQPLKVTRRKDAIVFINGEEYIISNTIYDSGKFIGFEAERKYQYFSEMIKPEERKWVVVRDADGKEHYNHQWNGYEWYMYVRDNDVGYGWRSDVDIVSWRYQ